MPRAPQIEQQVRDIALPGVRVSGAPSAESYGAGVGELGSRIGRAFYEQEIESADRTAVFEADRKAAELQLALQGKLQQTKGKNVLGFDEVLKKEWDDGLAQIDKGLTNNRQRGQFSSLSRRRGMQLYASTQEHVATEYGRFQDSETDQTIESAHTMIRANPDNPMIITNEMSRALSAARAQAQRKGEYGKVTEGMFKDPTFRKTYEDRGEVVPGVGEEYLSQTFTERQATIKSGLHTAVIHGFLAKNQDLFAKQYFDQHANDFTAKDRDALEKTVNEGTTIGQARRIVDKLIENKADEAGVLDAVRLEPDPKVAQLAREYAVQYFSDKRRVTKQINDNTYEESARKINQAIKDNPGVYQDPRTVLNYKDWIALPQADKDALARVAKESAQGDDRPNDNKLWLDFLDLKPEAVANLSRRDFELNYWQHFDNHTRQRAETQWNAYKDAAAKGKDQADPKVTASLTFKDQVSNAWKLSGLIDPSKDRGKWSKDEETMFVRFENEAARDLQAYEMTKLEGKRHATPDEVRDVIEKVKKRATQKVFTEGWFSYKEKPVIGVEEDEKHNVMVPIDKIPEDSLKDLRRYIESQGKTVTADKLRRAYGQRVLGNREAFNKIVNE